jgi:hypothetical protein
MRKESAIRILFNRTELMQVCRYTSVTIFKIGSLWVEAWSTPADIETFKLNNWSFRAI